MKKIVVAFLLMFLVVGLTQVAFAQLKEKKAELARVNKYIITLDEKIRKARGARKINKIAEINEIKRNSLQRAKKLRKEIAKLEKGKPKTRRPRYVGPKGRGGLQASVGLGGGSLLLGIGHGRPIQPNMDIVIDAGYGLGNQFSVLTAGVSGVMLFDENYAGLRVGLSNYSETLSNVPGLSGNVTKGGKIGLGVFAGKSLGAFKAQIGYDTALGLTAGAVFKF